MKGRVGAFIGYMTAAVTLIGALVGAAWAVDGKYAQKSEVASSLSGKADKSEVREHYRIILENELDDVTYELFQLELFNTHTEVQRFRMKQLNDKTDKINKILDETLK